jgi:hypothetical protein
VGGGKGREKDLWELIDDLVAIAALVRVPRLNGRDYRWWLGISGGANRRPYFKC